MKRRKKNSLAIQSLMLWCFIKLMLSVKAHQYCLCKAQGLLLIQLVELKFSLDSAINCRMSTGFHRMCCKKGKTQNWMDVTQSGNQWLTNREDCVCIKYLGKIFCATDSWDTVIAKYINICCVIITVMILLNIIAFKRIRYSFLKKTQYNITSDIVIHLLSCTGNLLLKSDFSFLPLQVFINFDPL